jgi:hypothetical protein
MKGCLDEWVVQGDKKVTASQRITVIRQSICFHHLCSDLQLLTVYVKEGNIMGY